MKGNFLKVFTLLALSLTLVVPTVSAEKSSEKSSQDSNDRIVTVYKATENGLKEVSIEEYEAAIAQSKQQQKEINAQKLLSSSNVLNKLVSPVSPTVQPSSILSIHAYEYDEDVWIPRVVRDDLKRRISVYYPNDTDTKLEYSVSWGASQSKTMNVSLTSSGEYDAVSAGITVGASWTETYSESTSAVKDVSARSYGWIDYTPIMGNSFGWMTHYYTNPDDFSEILEEQYWLDIYVPIEMTGGLPDGYYVFTEAPCSGGVCDPT